VTGESRQPERRKRERQRLVPGEHYLTFAELQKPFEFSQMFGNQHPVELEIGAGRGDFLLGYCAEHPDINLVAVERKLAYLGRGINKAAAASLQAVHIYFPDPWPKKRHLKRRLVQPDFVTLLAQKVVSGGWLHLRTDHLNYFEQMMEVMGAQTYFAPEETPTAVAQHKTGFERRFAEQGIPGNYASYRRI